MVSRITPGIITCCNS